MKAFKLYQDFQNRNKIKVVPKKINFEGLYLEKLSLTSQFFTIGFLFIESLQIYKNVANLWSYAKLYIIFEIYNNQKLLSFELFNFVWEVL